MKFLVLMLLILVGFPFISQAGAPPPAVQLQQYKNEGGFWGSKAIGGTTENDYPANANCRWKSAYLFKEKTIYIFNTGSTNGLVFKVVGYPTDEGEGSFPYVMTNSDGDPLLDIAVADGDVAVINLGDDKVQIIDIFVKSATEDNDTDFACIATGVRNQ